jgi:hypothetical protein
VSPVRRALVQEPQGFWRCARPPNGPTPRAKEKQNLDLPSASSAWDKCGVGSQRFNRFSWPGGSSVLAPRSSKVRTPRTPWLDPVHGSPSLHPPHPPRPPRPSLTALMRHAKISERCRTADAACKEDPCAGPPVSKGTDWVRAPRGLLMWTMARGHGRLMWKLLKPRPPLCCLSSLSGTQVVNPFHSLSPTASSRSLISIIPLLLEPFVDLYRTTPFSVTHLSSRLRSSYYRNKIQIPPNPPKCNTRT